MTDSTQVTETPNEPETFRNIIDHTDEELLALAEPMWADLVKYSNEGEYGKFIRKFSYDLLLGLNEVEVGKQFAKSELTRSLDPKYDFLGFIRRSQHVTCLYRVRSTKKEGEWLGRLVLGYVHGVNTVFDPAVMTELEGKEVGDIIEVPIDYSKLCGPRDEALVITENIHNVPEEYREVVFNLTTLTVRNANEKEIEFGG